MNFMDYCFITILILCGFAGMYQGLVRSVIGVLSIVLTFFISISYYPRLAVIIMNNTSIDEMLKKSITSNLDTTLKSIPGTDTLFRLNDAFVNVLVDKIQVPPALRNYVMSKINIDISSFNTSQIIDVLSSSWVEIFIKVMAFIILFAGLQFIFVLLQNGLGVFFTLPILSEINLLGGFILGLLQGIVVLYVICLGWSMLSGSPMYREVFTDLNASRFAKEFYNHNLLLELLIKCKIF